jgi:hypothetical protein
MGNRDAGFAVSLRARVLAADRGLRQIFILHHGGKT